MQPESDSPQQLGTSPPEDLIRQGYTIQRSGDKVYAMPSVLEERDVDLNLAKVLKPDFSQALQMDVGVSRFIQNLIMPTQMSSSWEL